MKGRAWNSKLYRYGFNGKENDHSWGKTIQDYGFRLYSQDYAKFLSVDPLFRSFAWNSVYAFAENSPIIGIDLEGLEAFFVHGTKSNSYRWHKNGVLLDGAKILLQISGNKFYDDDFEWFAQTQIEDDLGFNWGNGLTNTKKDRKRAAKNLTHYIITKITNQTLQVESYITLIGHSHGGNVSIQAIPLLRKELDRRGYNKVRINLITVSTPAENETDDNENPSTHENLIDKHIHIYNNIDGIQENGATVFGMNDFDKVYENKFTQNIEIDVSKKYENHEVFDSHSFDVESDILKEYFKDGKLPKINENE
jgi:RHS repeat-associated protein